MIIAHPESAGMAVATCKITPGPAGFLPTSVYKSPAATELA